MFGRVIETPQRETTPFYPRSPYGVAKTFGHYITRNYRESYDLHASSGILFNHESPRRGVEFVTRKITRGVAQWYYDRDSVLELGNLDARRDWGHAADYVDAMWRMVQQDDPGEYVIATGVSHTVREFVTAAFAAIGVDIGWSGSGICEVGYSVSQELVHVNHAYYRPAEVDLLCGDATLARRELGWEPATTFDALVAEMVEADIEELQS
jgi:GDPmannose 4,6-dehydratase